MRKTLGKGILAGTLFTFFLVLGVIPINASEMKQITAEVELIESNMDETTEVALAEFIGDISTEAIPIEFSRARITIFDLEEKRFIDFFPDKFLANKIAAKFYRTSTDIVTQEELNTLTSIDFTYSLISDITGIDSLSNLQSLSFGHNYITEIPDSIGDLIHLQALHLHGNEFTEIPASIGNLKNLQTLDLRYNQITEIPASIGDLQNLQFLDLSSCEFTEIPASIGHLKNLQVLPLDDNQIIEIPDFIGDLHNLKTLGLGFNQITKIPNFIDNLQILDLSYNQITEIPSYIGDFLNLQILAIGDNQIVEIPASIGDLINLHTLHLDYNQITEIPASIGNLKNLQSLDLSSNKITEISYSTMNFLPTLKVLYFNIQRATLNPITISNGSNIEYTNLIPALIRHLQNLNNGQLNGYWTIYKPDGTSITIRNNLQNAMNQFVFEQTGEYLVEYYVPQGLGYIVNGKSIHNLKYTTRITTTAQEAEHRTVSYNLNGGELISGSEFEMVGLSEYPSQVPVVAHSKMRFVGWTNENGIFVDPTTILIRNDTTFTAQYEEIKFLQVRYNAGRGMMIQGSSREVVEKGGKPTNVPIVEHLLGEFIGWKDQAGNFVDPATVIVTRNITFTAYYEIDED